MVQREEVLMQCQQAIIPRHESTECCIQRQQVHSLASGAAAAVVYLSARYRTIEVVIACALRMGRCSSSNKSTGFQRKLPRNAPGDRRTLEATPICWKSPATFTEQTPS